MPCENAKTENINGDKQESVRYETLWQDCQLANQDAYLEETLKPKSDVPVDWTYNFTKDQMEVHTQRRRAFSYCRKR